MKKKLGIMGGSVFGLLPMIALAAITPQTGTTTGGVSACLSGVTNGTGTITDFVGVLCKISQILNAVIPVLIALGVVYFVWGVIQYVVSNDEEAKTTGRNRMIWGIIGLAVIIGLWGLVNILKNTFVPQGNNQQITYPTVPY